MKALDLFSCIGCHAIGFHRAGIETVAFCEFNETRRAELRHQFPETPIYDASRILVGASDLALRLRACHSRCLSATQPRWRT